MEKETIKVHDTRVTGISRQEAGALVTIALKGISFQPGQFLMVKTCDGEVRWGYPYLIEEAGPESVTVLAPARSDLYRQLPDSEVAVWGPRGRGPWQMVMAPLSWWRSLLRLTGSCPSFAARHTAAVSC